MRTGNARLPSAVLFCSVHGIVINPDPSHGFDVVPPRFIPLIAGHDNVATRDVDAQTCADFILDLSVYTKLTMGVIKRYV